MNTNLKQRLITFVIVVVFALLLLVPNFSPETFRGEKGESTWISHPIALGLDLKGGVHLMYEVQTKEAVKSRLQTLVQAIRGDLRKEKIAVTKSAVNEQNQVELTLLSARNAIKAKEVIEQTYRREMSFEQQTAAGDEESSRVTLRYSIPKDEAARIERESVNQAVETLNKRVNQFGVAEPLIQKVGVDRILLQMPGVKDIEAVKRVVGKLAQLEFRLIPNPGSSEGKIKLKDRDGAAIEVEDTVLMSGDAVASARTGIVQGQVDVSLTLTSEGARTFRRITTENVGRQLAIVLDGIVYSHPNIREAITGGQASITGGFTLEEASELSVVLRAGALPASLKILEERTVGPTLGQQSISAGIIASLVGMLGITLFMIFYYGKSGALAMFTIALNIFFLMSVLSFFGATLTLPGLAGLALTAGMAVDANIIIFERIRDEIKIGASRDAAVAAGFDKAFSAIFDSNITTILAGIILYILGSGPIMGFALTLSLGTITTVYCATTVSKLFFDLMPLSGSKNGLSI